MRPAYVRLVGNSSLGSNSARSLLRAVRTYTRVANFVVSTEVGRNERSRILGRILGWGVVHFEDTALSGEDECAISFRKLGWRKIRANADPLSGQRVARRGGQRVQSVDALFENRRTKQRVMVCAFHLPNTEDGQYGIWVECVGRLRVKAQRWNADPSIDAVILAGDWNWDIRSDTRRAQLRRTFPGAQLTWSASQNRMPTAGTHRRNLIDYAAVYGGTITEARLLADDASSDHRPWRMVVKLPRVAG